jgi:hypothetical protein
MGSHDFRANKSGQVIIVSALLVALVLLATALYVIEVGKQVPMADASEPNISYDYEQSARSTLISALANASGSGSPDVLCIDLAELRTVILTNSYQALLTMNYQTLNSSGYQNGLWIYRGAEGKGISSSYASFAFTSSSPSATSTQEYTLNVTSAMQLSGSYQQLNETIRQVHLTINLSNEDKPALMHNFAVSYQNATEWVIVDSPTTFGFGDGAYSVTFNAESTQPSDPLVISLVCQDARGIFVGANLTCTSA